MHLAWALKIRYDNIDAAPCVCVLWKWRPELRFVLSVWRLGTLGAGPFLIDHLVEKAQAAGGGSNSGAKIFKGCVVKKISAVVEHRTYRGGSKSGDATIELEYRLETVADAGAAPRVQTMPADAVLVRLHPFLAVVDAMCPHEMARLHRPSAHAWPQ